MNTDLKIIVVGFLVIALFTGIAHSYIGDDSTDGYSCPTGQFVDEDGDGICDNFVDEDGDGICDTGCDNTKKGCNNCFTRK